MQSHCTTVFQWPPRQRHPRYTERGPGFGRPVCDDPPRAHTPIYV